MIQAPRLDGRFRLSEIQARELAKDFGTPLYVIDETAFRSRIRRYRDALAASYPRTELSFAAKANSTLAVLAIAHQEGCVLDVASEGELRAALAAGAPGSTCRLHGNFKRSDELDFALAQGIGEIVVDSLDEIEMLAARAFGATRLVLRLAPAVNPVTHEKISTGQADTKFGLGISSGAAEAAVRRCVELGLPLSGYHCHVGSQLLDPEAQLLGGETIARFAVQMAKLHGVTPLSLNVGGGLGVRYVDEEPMEVEEYCRLVAAGVSRALEGSGLAPTLAHEPGRALVAESGVTLYTVGPIKEVDLGRGAQRVYVSVDGGMSDNPRPALYDAAYTVLPLAAGDGPTRKVTVCGRHCEADTMFRDVELPVDLKPGDLLQVLCTGAYASSMASNYNRFPRPATVLIRPDGKPEIVQERETWDQVLAREPIPEDLRT